MKPRLFAPLLLAAAVLLPCTVPSNAQTNERGQILIVGQNIKKSMNVSGKSIVIKGSGNTITWSGHTPLLTVSGTGNKVYADAAQAIIVKGDGNTVYWKRRYNNREPRVQRSGSGNFVMLAKKAAAPKMN